MKKSYFHFTLMSLLGLLTVSCSNNDEPATPPQYRISEIHSDNSLQLFEYNPSGRISAWKYKDLTQHSSDACSATYKYLENEGTIEIHSEEQWGADTWSFNETLYLNPNGTASHATGSATIMNEEDRLLMKKNYSVDFHYNSLHQLTNINIEEKRTDDNGWEEVNGLEWFIALEWTDNNLTKYSEYSNINKPYLSKTFTYYGGETAHYLPIVQGPILRHYYLPLQYQGLLGSQSVSLVRDMAVSSNSLNYSSTFSYDISASIYSSAIEGYSELTRGKEIKYTIVWDSYNQN